MLVCFDIDGMVRKQNLHDEYDIQYIKCRDLEEDIKYSIEEYDELDRLNSSSNMKDWFDPNQFNISLLGSGSYHHFTMFIIEKITKPFYLIDFDWHYDAGVSRWKWQRDKKQELMETGQLKIKGGGCRYNFGGWTIPAALLPNCKGILMIGMGGGHGDWERKWALGPNPKEDYNIDVISSGENYYWFDQKIKSIIPDDIDIYITVCKDVLNKHEVLTDWNNGEMTQVELLHMLSAIKVMYGDRICGVDICGEKAKYNSWFDDEGEFIHNNIVRHKLLNKNIIDLFGGKELYGK
tara:strand:+ start:727 stop:1605 length:879 start_codon:yes stop_codon:yes gene_type:complete